MPSPSPSADDSDDQYIPSQVYMTEAVHGTGRLTGTRQSTVRAREHLSNLYAPGGVLDSQTSDSQYDPYHGASDVPPTNDMTYPVLYESQLDAEDADDERDSEAPESGGAADPASLSDDSNAEYPLAPPCAHEVHLFIVQGDLDLAVTELRMLRTQVEHLEKIRELQEKQIHLLHVQLAKLGLPNPDSSRPEFNQSPLAVHRGPQVDDRTKMASSKRKRGV